MRIRAFLSAGNGRVPTGNRGLAFARVLKLRSWGRALSTTLLLRKLRRKVTTAVFVPGLFSQLPTPPDATQKDRSSPLELHPLQNMPQENQACRRPKQRNPLSCAAVHRPYPAVCNDHKRLARFPRAHAGLGRTALPQLPAALEIHAPSL